MVFVSLLTDLLCSELGKSSVPALLILSFVVVTVF